MKNNELSYNSDKEILEFIKETILKRHPVVDDRVHILYPKFNEPRTPEIDINFRFYRVNDSDITEVTFLDGTSSFKTSIDERIEINGLISKNVICDLISCLLTDHDYFKDIKEFDTSFELSMGVDACDENMHGISCGEINLIFDFYSHPDNKRLLNEYLKTIIRSFYEKIKGIDFIQDKFSDYCNEVKSEFIKSLTNEELKIFINLLNNNDLCKLIYSIPNNRFIELYNEYYNKRENQNKHLNK